MKKKLLILIVLCLMVIVVPKRALASETFWEIQSIDTMKHSRDIAREKLNEDSFISVIDDQIRLISETGATHVSLGTPYDSEFLPFLKSWVFVARKYDLNVWYRGNFSGWEGWFNYGKISRDEHITKTIDFILKNPDLFQDGDIFTACTECENGGPGDPRFNGDANGHRQFLIDEYKATNDAFRKINKNVRSNFYTMNGDVAKLIMDIDTTKALGGIVVIDHYVGSTDKLANDIIEIAKRSGGRVVLGEFGAPIPDIHGFMSQTRQAEWVASALDKISKLPELIGINYWTSFGSSTQIWNNDGTPRAALKELKRYFKPNKLEGIIVNEIGKPIDSVLITDGKREEFSEVDGTFAFPYLEESIDLGFSASGYFTKEHSFSNLDSKARIILKKEHENIIFIFRKFIYEFFGVSI